MNPLVVTFEFTDYQTKAQKEIKRGVVEGPYLNCPH